MSSIGCFATIIQTKSHRIACHQRNPYFPNVYQYFSNQIPFIPIQMISRPQGSSSSPTASNRTPGSRRSPTHAAYHHYCVFILFSGPATTALTMYRCCPPGYRRPSDACRLFYIIIPSTFLVFYYLTVLGQCYLFGICNLLCRGV